MVYRVDSYEEVESESDLSQEAESDSESYDGIQRNIINDEYIDSEWQCVGVQGNNFQFNPNYELVGVNPDLLETMQQASPYDFWWLFVDSEIIKYLVLQTNLYAAQKSQQQQKNFARLKKWKEICIDESVVPFLGRLVFQQFIKNKKHRYGTKINKLCAKEKYTLGYRIYEGRDRSAKEPVVVKVVMELMEPYLHFGRTLYSWAAGTQVLAWRKNLLTKIHT